MGAWTGWVVLVFVAFEALEFFFKKKGFEEPLSIEFDMDYPTVHPGSQTSRLKTTLQYFLLGFHILVSLGLAIALIVLISKRL
ncbi:unnamed protein product [Didymodactylos carnosus]|nr:unnamed protein product [Didymodactylos carnosus]CAF3738509.1 unnamed protein product [Didymodactylos carnosus]